MRIFLSLICIFSSWLTFAQPSDSELSVWVNEAIVSTYTFNYENYLDEQKRIAHYFAPDAWITYSNALTASKILDTIQKNKFKVSAVAQSTPNIKLISPDKWSADMDVLVVYSNNNTEQRQTLKVNIGFSHANPPAGVRGLQIDSYQSKVETPSCSCNR